MKNGTVRWFEVMGQDTERLRAFYGEVVGWSLQPVPDMDYQITGPDHEGLPGGVGKVPAGPGWTTFYVEVDDLQAAVERATALGGTVAMPAMPIGRGRTVAVVQDPEGHPIGLWHEEA